MPQGEAPQAATAMRKGAARQRLAVLHGVGAAMRRQTLRRLRVVAPRLGPVMLGLCLGVTFEGRPWSMAATCGKGLWLAAVLKDPTLRPYDAELFSSAFNFGPTLEANRTVAELVAELLKHWPGKWEDRSDPSAVHEAKLLSLAIDKAFHLLGWKPVWGFERTVEETVSWYRRAESCAAPQMAAFTSQQIRAFCDSAANAGVPWACRTQ